MPTKKKAKKKAVKKLATKNKKKVAKTAKKKTASTSKKTSARYQVTVAAVKTDLFYACRRGNCIVDRRHPAGDAGDHVIMHATNTDVSIQFTSESPFESGAGFPTPIEITKGDKQDEVLKNKSGEYSYDLRCPHSLCRTSVEDPSMIIN